MRRQLRKMLSDFTINSDMIEEKEVKPSFSIAISDNANDNNTTENNTCLKIIRGATVAVLISVTTFTNSKNLTNISNFNNENNKKTSYTYSEGNNRDNSYNMCNKSYSNHKNMNNYINLRLPSEYTDKENTQKEVEKMRVGKQKELNKLHTEFLLVSATTLILSIIGLVIFAMTGKYLIHPSLYVAGAVMGIGWGVTALTSIFTTRRQGR